MTIGTLCVLDDEPREATAVDMETLTELACLAEALVDARAVALRAAEAAEQRRLAMERLERERRQFKQAERMADMGSWRYDIAHECDVLDGRSLCHPRTAHRWRRAEWRDHELSSPEPDRTVFLDAVMRTLDTGEPFEIDADLVTAKGNARRVRCSCEIELSKGSPVALIGLIQDITERHDLEERLRRQARTDDLTQLPNRAEFNRVLAKACSTRKPSGASWPCS